MRSLAQVAGGSFTFHGGDKVDRYKPRRLRCLSKIQVLPHLYGRQMTGSQAATFYSIRQNHLSQHRYNYVERPLLFPPVKFPMPI